MCGYSGKGCFYNKDQEVNYIIMWTFLQAYDYIKGHPEDFHLCDHKEELSGEHSAICVYHRGEFVGKLRWRIERGAIATNKPTVDDELQTELDNHKSIKLNT